MSEPTRTTTIDFHGAELEVFERDIPAHTERCVTVRLPPVGEPEDGEIIDTARFTIGPDLPDLTVEVPLRGGPRSRPDAIALAMPAFEAWAADALGDLIELDIDAITRRG